MIPRWKRWWSYLAPIHLETVASSVNDYLEVYLISNRLRLTTMDAIYSYDDRYFNFVSAFKEIKLPENDAQILVLGLGLGSIPLILERKFRKKYIYTAIEKDSASLYLFNRYQKDRLKSPVNIFHADAVDFLRENTDRYHMICVDVFIGDAIPSHLKETPFLNNLRTALHPGGIVLWNMLYDTENQVEEADAFLELLFKNYFPDTVTHQVLGNIILIGHTS